MLIVLALLALVGWLLMSIFSINRHDQYFHKVLLPYFIRDGDRQMRDLDEIDIENAGDDALQLLNDKLRRSEARLLKFDRSLRNYIGTYKWLPFHPWRSPKDNVDEWLRLEIEQE